MKSDIPFNMNYSYDETLREAPEDKEQMAKGLEWLNEELIRQVPQSSPLEGALLLHQICVYSRIMGDYRSAETCGKDALKVFQEAKNLELSFFMKLRLAQVFHYKQSYIKASEIYAKALEKVQAAKKGSSQKYLEFILFHFGCMKFERGFYAEASSYLSRALDERLIQGDLKKIEDVQYAMNRVNEKLTGQ